MTAYVVGATRAHVMKFAGPAGRWRSLCGRRELDLSAWYLAHPNLGDERPPLRLTEIEGQPPRPWCSFCVRHVHQLASSVGLI